MKLSRRGAAAGVAALTLLALALRLHGLGFSLPHSTFHDGRGLVDQVAALRAGEPDPKGHALYPHLVPRVASWLPEATSGHAADLDEHLARAALPYRQLRIVSVLLSLLILPATYRLARAFLDRGASLFATALVATSLLHVSLSQQERPHGALASFAVLTVVVAIGLQRHPRPATFVLAGVSAALAVGSLHSGLAVLPPLVAAYVLQRRGSGTRAAWAGVAVLLVAAAVPLFYPFHFTGGEVIEVEERARDPVLDLSGHAVRFDRFDGTGFYRSLGWLYSYDPVLLVLAAAGSVAALLRARRSPGPGRRRSLVVALAFAVPYVVAIGLYGRTPERFLLPLLPFLACLAGAALPARARWLAIVLVLPPLGLAWRLGTVRSVPDTYARAALWLEEHADREADRVALILDPNQDLPLLHSAEALAHNADWTWASRWVAYQRGLDGAPEGSWDLRVPDLQGLEGRSTQDLVAAPLAVLGELGATHAVVELVSKGARSDVQRRIREALADGAERLHRVSPLEPDPGKHDRLLCVSLAPWQRPLFLRVLEARSMGPTLEVYRLP